MPLFLLQAPKYVLQRNVHALFHAFPVAQAQRGTAVHARSTTSLALTALLGLSACQGPEYSVLGEGRVNSAGPVQMINAPMEAYSASRLAVIIETVVPPAQSAPGPEAILDADGKDAVARLDRAMLSFSSAPYTKVNPADRETEQNRLRDARNTIQDQLIASSNNRCNVYKTHLRRLSSNTSFGLGSLATAAGAAGAIVTGGASQALSGAASALSGVNAEFQKDFFNSLVTAVIIPGIDRQRADLRNDIVGKSCLGISDYPLSLAIAEAIRYHGACAADVGIAASGQAVARTSPDSLSSVLVAAQQIRKISGALSTPTNAEARNAAARAATDAAAVTVRKSAMDAAAADLQAAKSQNAADTVIAALQKKLEAATNAYQTAFTKAAGSKAVADNLGVAGSPRAEAANITPAAPGTVWNDPTPSKPLVGDNLVSVNCRPLDSNGKAKP